MTSTEIREIVNTAPFQPFRLHLADGRKIEIKHPEYLKVFVKSPRLIVEYDDGSWELVNLPLVLSVEAISSGS